MNVVGHGLIYLITNLVNGKYYVGLTTKGSTSRFREHLNEARRGKGSVLHQAIRKYGKENFIIEEIATANSFEQLKTLEQLWIVALNSTAYGQGCGYNRSPGGDCVASEVRTMIAASRKLHAGTKDLACLVCGRVVSVQKHRQAEFKYCSHSCHAKVKVNLLHTREVAVKVGDARRGKPSVLKGRNLHTAKCQHCQNDMSVSKVAKSVKKFCSRQCYWDNNRSHEFSGARYVKRCKLWSANISIGGRSRNLGYFKTGDAAAVAYQQALKIKNEGQHETIAAA